MSEIAAKTIYSSQGIIRPGEPIPEKLPKEEVKSIRNAGGFAVLPATVRTDADRTAVYADAVNGLQEAEAAVAAAKTDDDKAEARKRLEAARKTLFDLAG